MIDLIGEMRNMAPILTKSTIHKAWSAEAREAAAAARRGAGGGEKGKQEEGNVPWKRDKSDWSDPIHGGRKAEVRTIGARRKDESYEAYYERERATVAASSGYKKGESDSEMASRLKETAEHYHGADAGRITVNAMKAIKQNDVPERKAGKEVEALKVENRPRVDRYIKERKELVLGYKQGQHIAGGTMWMSSTQQAVSQSRRYLKNKGIDPDKDV